MGVEPIPFQVGAVSHAAAWLLAAGCMLYATGTLVYAYHAFRRGLEDRWSAVLAGVVMALLALLLGARGGALFPAPFSVVAVVFYFGGILFTLTYTLGRFHRFVDRFRAESGARLIELLESALPGDGVRALERLLERRRADAEGRRKTPHLLMGLFLLAYAAVGFPVLRAVSGLVQRTGAAGTEWAHNLFLVANAETGTWLVAGHFLATPILLLVLFVILPNELLRLRFPELSYPFKATILGVLRRKEQGLFGAHYYISATLPLAILWLTRDAGHWDVTIPAVMAVLAVTVFADTASALVGIRFGRRKWFHNANKSYIGSSAGTLVAFAVALPFVGGPMAVVTAAVFLIVDILGPVPVPVSDNILNPLALAAVYTLMQGHLDPLIPFY